MFKNFSVKFLSVYQAALLVLGVATGVVYFREFARLQWYEWNLFMFGAALTLWGVLIVTVLDAYSRALLDEDRMKNGEKSGGCSSMCSGLHFYTIGILDALNYTPPSKSMQAIDEDDKYYEEHPLLKSSA